ncbi:hypothetical protein [Nocardioides agariphilus]|nr:hypothetical protein [Nocardioides agariphilus]
MRRSKFAVAAVVAALVATLGATSVAASPDAAIKQMRKSDWPACC